VSPVHLHLLLNHVPVIGLIGALLFLLIGYLMKNDVVIRVALAFVVGVALVTIPAFVTGEPAEEVVEALVPTEAAIEAHEEAALPALILIEVAGSLALLALFLRASTRQRGFVLGVLILGVFGFLLAARTANLGGKIRHSEISNGAVAAMPADGESEDDSRKMGDGR
jgi:uncharacterized membrane protein